MTCVNITNRPKASTYLTPVDWELHSNSNCSVCARYAKSCEGQLNKFAKRSPGRPAEFAPFSKWTKTQTVLLKEKTPFDENIFEPTLKLDASINTQLDLCKCRLCHKIVSRPVQIVSCEHSFCLVCVTKELEEKKTRRCPVCNKSFLFKGITPSVTIRKIVGTLIAMGCGRNFRIDEARSGHEKTCRGPPPRPLTLTDVLKVETKELLPKDAERVAFHVIKHKIANSHLPNRGILFASGGPKVIFQIIN